MMTGTRLPPWTWKSYTEDGSTTQQNGSVSLMLRAILMTLNAQPQSSFKWQKNELYLPKATFLKFACSCHLIVSDAGGRGRDNASFSQNMAFLPQALSVCSVLSAYCTTPFCPHFRLLCISWQSTHCQGPSQCLLHHAVPNLPITRFSRSLDFSSTFNPPFYTFSHTGHLWTKFTPMPSLLCEGR